MSRYLSEMLAFIILFLLILMMIMGGEMFYDMSTYNSYRSQVVKIAQRSDGYTPEVRGEMNNLSRLYYNNSKQHQLETEPTSVPNLWTRHLPMSDYRPYNMVNYGHEMKFNIIMKVPSFMSILPTSKTNFGNNGANSPSRQPSIEVHPVIVTSQVRDTPDFPGA